MAACENQSDKELYITSGQSVVSKGGSDPMPAAGHTEADTRFCLHVQDAMAKGATNIIGQHSRHRCCGDPGEHLL